MSKFRKIDSGRVEDPSINVQQSSAEIVLASVIVLRGICSLPNSARNRVEQFDQADIDSAAGSARRIVREFGVESPRR